MADEKSVEMVKGRITVFTISGCPHCRSTKTFLSSHSLPYVEVNLDVYPSRRKELYGRTSLRTVPQTFFNEKFVGGNEELQSLSTIALENLVNYVRENDAGPLSPSLPDEAEKEGEREKDFAFVCEPDELLALAQAMRASLLVKDRVHNLKSYSKCFLGNDAVEWLCTHEHANSEEEAIALGNKMLKEHIFHHVKNEKGFENDKSLYRFLQDEKTKALNAQEISNCQPTDASLLGEDIRRSILALYDRFLSADGRYVDYEGIANSKEYASYKLMASELQRIEVKSLTDHEKLAFFINVYNALIVHAQVEKGNPKNDWKRWKFFNKMSYRIGGHIYTLQDIENGILRGNRVAPYCLGKPFGKSDIRRQYALSYCEPRIHFALVCGAKSCPPIKTYSAKDVDSQLTEAAMAFLEGDALLINVEKKELSLSKIFDWYKEDFGGSNSNLIAWISSFLSPDKRTALELVLKAKKYKVTFQEYDWGQNST